MNDDFKPVSELLKKIKIKPRDISLYESALTHSSFAYENDVESNERLEFLGDAVLEIFMSEYLYKNQKELAEGIMTKKRAQLVCEEALFQYSNKINLTYYLKLGRGEKVKGASQATIADAFEALMGAVYLDLGHKEARKVFYQLVIPNIDLTSDIKDFKTILQEYVQGDRKTIVYKIINESGPSHDKVFEAAVYLDGTIILGNGVGKTKKEAEQKAAEEALKKVSFYVD
ncbi:MAG: ribonuclease III [Acholeplasmataceae bacterium]|nr:ribonuclease III [Acholeplasmataceae bacterium]